MKKRMFILETFLNNILKDNLLKNSNIFFDFLSNKDINIIKKKYNNIENEIDLKKKHTRSGKIIINKKILSDEKIFNKLKNNIDSNIDLIHNLQKKITSLIKEINNISNKLNDISIISKKLYENCVMNSENENILKSYNLLEKFMNNIINFNNNFSKNLEINLKDYFKYVKLEYYSIKELYDKYDYQQNLYLKYKEKILSNNNNNNQINENKNIENIQLNLFFYAISFKNEFERLREKIGFNNINNIKTFKNNIINSLSELINKINIKNL
jgi:hypothetical protein